MKKKEDWEVLRDFYLYSDLNDEKELDNYLLEKNIDIDEIALELQEFLRAKKAEIALERGRKFKEKYLKELSDTKIAETEHDPALSVQDFALAFRNKEDVEDDFENMTEDEKKLQIIKKLTEKKESSNNKKEP